MDATDHNLIKTVFALKIEEELVLSFRACDRDLLWQLLKTISGRYEPRFETRISYNHGSDGIEFWLYVTRTK